MNEKKKEIILEKLRENGCRITNQRKLLIDVFVSLQDEFYSYKDIYYEARKRDRTIGQATVMRFMNEMIDIGIVERVNIYKINL